MDGVQIALHLLHHDAQAFVLRVGLAFLGRQFLLVALDAADAAGQGFRVRQLVDVVVAAGAGLFAVHAVLEHLGVDVDEGSCCRRGAPSPFLPGRRGSAGSGNWRFPEKEETMRKGAMAVALMWVAGSAMAAGLDVERTGPHLQQLSRRQRRQRRRFHAVHRWPAGDYLANIMKQWKYDERGAATMNRIVKGLSDDEIDALAAYFAKKPWVPAPQR
jgi:hypothetical protein